MSGGGSQPAALGQPVEQSPPAGPGQPADPGQPEGPSPETARLLAEARAPERVLVVGAGLIGTSVALALRSAGAQVLLADRDRARRDLAWALDAGRPWAGETVEHAVIAVPPAAVAGVLVELQKAGVASTYSDVASVKVGPQVDVETSGADPSSFCGAHPIAGRERPGAAGASADLFVGRSWVLCPSPATSEAALRAAAGVAVACGADVTVLPPPEHDSALARVSHVPQLVASLLAARLLAGGGAGAARLAGQGLRDTTRIAASDPALWADIVTRNAAPVAEVLAELAADLDRLRAALARLPVTGDEDDAARVAEEARAAVHDLLARGNEGRARLPGKHGSLASRYTVVPVLIADEPGALARLFADCAATGVNVEDVHLEHVPGRARGVAEVLVEPSQAPVLADRLAAAGWSVHLPDQADRL